MIRTLTDNDIPSALALCRNAGWNQLQTDWARLLAYEPDGCFVADIDGQIVGTVTTTRYGTDLAWIGMMLVDDRFRRRGIATALMNASLSYLRDRDVACIKLDATPLGQPVYERLGFQPDGSFHRWSRDGDILPQWNPERPANRLSPLNLQLDRSAFSTDRRGWLNRLAADSHVVSRNNCFGMARRGFLANYLGPVIADNKQEAKQIVAELLSQRSGQTFWDIPPGNSEAARLAESFGFQPVRDLTRMRIGATSVSPTMQFQFALSDPGTG